MEKIQFDSGVKSFRFNGTGTLRFHPGDPNLYARFMESTEKLQELEKELQAKMEALSGEDSGVAAVKLLSIADRKMKKLLSWVFGEENDFDKLLGGVSLLAVGENGQRVVTNLFHALEPVLLAGAQSCAREKAEQAVSKAKARRAAQE